VAEAKQGAIPRVAVAAKHGVSDAALKYHLYKSTGSTSVKSKAPTLLPVRLAGTVAKQVDLEFGAGLRLRFEEGYDPAYVAAVINRLRSPLLTLPSSVRIYFAVGPVDLRRGHDGLSGIVRGQWGMSLTAQSRHRRSTQVLHARSDQ